MKKTATNWLKAADNDFQAAQDMFSFKHYPYVILFCYWALEKTLKGLIAELKDEMPPRTNSLVSLRKMIIPADDWPFQNEFLADLTEYFLIHEFNEAEVSFESLVKKYNHDKAKETLDQSRKIIDWLRLALESENAIKPEKRPGQAKEIQIDRPTVEVNSEIMCLAKRAAEELSRVWSVENAYLFGSHVTGKNHRWSDIDLGIFVNRFEELSFEKQLKIMCDINQNYGNDLEFHFFDAEDLTNAESCSFAAEVLRTGIRIF